jgi:DNA mismatch repair protein MutS2
MSEGAQAFENIVRSAEESRIQAEEELRKTNLVKAEWQEKVRQLDIERQKLEKEKERLFTSAKAESRRIINERTAEAEELLLEIEDIFAKESLSEADLIKARTLKNRLADKAYDTEKEEFSTPQYVEATVESVKVGVKVFVKNINQEGVVQAVRLDKKEAEILCGSIRVRSKFSELSILLEGRKKEPDGKLPKWKRQQAKGTEKVSVTKSLTPRPLPTLEINVIGQTVQEALPDVEAFIDSAVIANLEEVRIVHGVGTGKLRAGIHEFLRKHRNVESFRLGKYGEGETGVTIVKIK